MDSFHYSDGGRGAAGFRGPAGDCACRAIAIAAQRPYREIYGLINDYARRERPRRSGVRRSSAREGLNSHTMRRLLAELGAIWTATMKIGSGCRVHVDPAQLPMGRLVLRLSGHYAAFIDGVLYDTHDCSRDGNRCVYGYWRFA